MGDGFTKCKGKDCPTEWRKDCFRYHPLADDDECFKQTPYDKKERKCSEKIRKVAKDYIEALPPSPSQTSSKKRWL